MNTKSVYYVKIIFALLSILLISSNSLKSQNLTFVRHPIDLDFDGIHRVTAIDLDSDGDLDIIGGSEITPTTASKGLAWWRNEGNNNWTRFTIDASFIHIMSIDTADINNDSYVDVIASSWHLHQIAWLKNSDDPTQGWIRYTIKSNFTNAHDAQCGDFDNDGDSDIVAVSATPGSIVTCENNGSSSSWPTTTISSSFGGALSAFVIDLDKDDDLDIIATASNYNQLAWWRNEGGNPISWTKNVIGFNFIGASEIDVNDINDDDRLDVISNAWKSNQVAYWSSNNSQYNTWTKYLVSDQLDTAADVRSCDLDKDDDIDIIAVAKIPGELVVYENSNLTWNEIQLQNNFYGGAALEIADLDDDGDIDIIAGASYQGVLYWWENTLITSLDDEPVKSILPQNCDIKIYPNPFNLTTNINYQIPESGNVVLNIYNTSGQKISTLVNEFQVKGSYNVIWDATGYGSGIYLIQIKSERINKIGKTILLK